MNGWHAYAESFGGQCKKPAIPSTRESLLKHTADLSKLNKRA